MKEQVLRNVFQINTDPKIIQKEDNSSIPVYVPEVAKCVEQYMRKGNVEANQRALTLVTSLQMAGRTMEPAWVTLDSLHFDQHFTGVFGNAPQRKKSKMGEEVGGVFSKKCFAQPVRSCSQTFVEGW